MMWPNSIHRLVLVSISCLVLASFAFSQTKDVVYLKNGSILKGTIVEQNLNKSIKLQTSEGNIFVYDFADIEKITRESDLSHGSPIERGSVLLSGEFGFSSKGGDLYGNSSGDRLTTLEFNPQLGFILAHGFALGLFFSVSTESQGNGSNTNWGVGPAFMYLIGDNASGVSAKGATYPLVNAGIMYLQATTKSGNNTYSASGFRAFFGGGVCHYITESVGIISQVNYKLVQIKPENGKAVNGNSLNVEAGLIIFLY